MKDLISVIVPFYNSEKYIKQCIESILHQSYNNLELILVNDCSTDASFKICKKISESDKRIKIINLEKNLGVSNARNIGIKNASGKFIIFVDSDDTISDNFLEKLIKKSDEKNLCRGYNFCKEKYYSKGEYIKKLIYGETFGSCCGYLINRKLCSDINFDVNTSYMEDSNYIVRIINKYNGVNEINNIMYNYIDNDKSATKRIDNPLIILHDYYYSIDEICKYVKENMKVKLNNLKVNNRKYSLLLDMCHNMTDTSKIDIILSDSTNKKILKGNRRVSSKIYLTSFGRNYLKIRIKIKKIRRLI